MESVFNESLNRLYNRLKEFENGSALPQSPYVFIQEIKDGLLKETTPDSIEKLSLISMTIQKLLGSEFKFSRAVRVYDALIDEIIEDEGGQSININALPISDDFRLLIEENLKIELRYYLSNIEEIIGTYRFERANSKPIIQITGPQTYKNLQPHFNFKFSKNTTAFLLYLLRQNGYIAKIDDKPLTLIMAPCFGHGAESTRIALGQIHSAITTDDWKELEEFAKLLLSSNPFLK